MPNENNSSAPLKTSEGAPVAQWQKRHPDEEGGAWQNTNRGDAMWWRDNTQGWEIRALYEEAPQAVAAQAPAAVAVPTDFELRERWRAAGGSFHGPCVETGTMPEAQLFPFLRALAATPAFPATEDSSAGDLATESVLIEGVAYTIPEAVALELLRLNIELVQRSEVQAEPVAERLDIDMHAEGRDPVEMLDRIFAIYQRSMGKPAPDAEMAQIVATTKEMIFSWWAEHRELIREALTAPQAQPADAKVQWWLAELDRYGNPALTDGAHGDRAGADRAAYLIESMGLGKGRKFAVARVELTTPVPNSSGVNHEAVAEINRAAMAAAQEGGNAAKEA